ncbi:MAG: hypothetical protein K0R27_2654 [Xanthobacteraceae bacterium]|jgi:hypothetical protein|nr:hypothetical protein [Xanthobacteraceae bacterium]
MPEWIVIPGPVPVASVPGSASAAEMAGTRPAMTSEMATWPATIEL